MTADNLQRRPTWRVTLAYCLTVLTLTLAGVAASFFAYLLLVLFFVYDVCQSGQDTGLVCTTNGQAAVVLLPWIGWLAAIISSIIGAALAVVCNRTLWLGLLASPLFYFGALAMSAVAIVAAGP